MRRCYSVDVSLVDGAQMSGGDVVGVGVQVVDRDVEGGHVGVPFSGPAEVFPLVPGGVRGALGRGT